MNTNDIKPNSHKYKAEQARERERRNKVVSGTAKVKKKSELSKLSSIFISEEAANVKSYIFMDVLVPAIKKAVSDIITDGIDMILYGGEGRSRNKSGSNTSYVSYSKYSDRDRRDRYSDSRRTGYDLGNIILDNRGDAEEVLSQMDDIIAEYKMASVADLYDLIGIMPKHTDNKYGWTNIRNARVERTRDGYAIRMPKPLPLD